MPEPALSSPILAGENVDLRRNNARLWRLLYAAMFAYRCVLSVLGQTVVARITLLGDASQYQSGLVSGELSSRGLDAAIDSNRQVATELTELVGAIFHSMFGGSPIMINIGFQTIAFVGIVVLLRQLDPRKRGWVFGLMMLPSFALWSSVAGKEAIVVFAMGIIGAAIVRLYDHRRVITVGLVAALSIIYLFRDHFLPAILFILVGTYLSFYARQRAFLALMGGVFSAALLYLLRDRVDTMAFAILPHFSIRDGVLTRDPYWIEKYDVFTKAPYGMFQSFFGPTIGEALIGPLQLLSFAESAVLVLVLVVLVLRGLRSLPVYSLIMAASTTFWILFATYPLGIMNSGTAIRYRTGYLMLIFVVVAFLLSRETFIRWSARTYQREGKTRQAPGDGMPSDSGTRVLPG
jgi:hypothetical protein